MPNYNSQFTGEQIDDAISKVKNKIVETSADKVSFSDESGDISSGNVSDALIEVAKKKTSNIHIGSDKPNNPEIDVWIDPSGEASEILPPVTALDNGKFLRVVDGAWAAVEINSAEGVEF